MNVQRKGRLGFWFWVLLGITLIMMLFFTATEAGAFWSPLTSPLQSPISPPTPLPVVAKKPKGLDACPLGCIERLEGMEWATCNVYCVQRYDLDVESKYVSGCWTGAYTGKECDGLLKWDLVTPTPEVVPTATVEVVEHWVYLGKWMGVYPLWQDTTTGKTRIDGWQ